MSAQHTPARADGHSYLWGQVFFTEPIGQWLCPRGHSCRWSIARTDAGVMGRFQRRRAAIAKTTGSAS
jgi:hypothetical protein